MPDPAYEPTRLAVDPWGRTMAEVCSECGAWVANVVAHTRWHAIPSVEVTPSVLHAVAANLRAQYPPVTATATVAQALANEGMRALADAIDATAGQVEEPTE